MWAITTTSASGGAPAIDANDPPARGGIVWLNLSASAPSSGSEARSFSTALLRFSGVNRDPSGKMMNASSGPVPAARSRIDPSSASVFRPLRSTK